MKGRKPIAAEDKVQSQLISVNKVDYLKIRSYAESNNQTIRDLVHTFAESL